ncbi:hypothetical protein PF008_g24819 [Phytophthora fragariae]|uniref:Uncharacterized protein n=1 Tax=Phytophthora fragariae TaxID=53985 RepID=A0A6G0QLT0_9STRA|nr:hypothetical protein PF008_g24819 [Phytophthora fragariae]
MERSKLGPDEGLEREVFDSSLKPKRLSHADASIPNKVYPTLDKPKQPTEHRNSNPKLRESAGAVQTFILRVTIALALCICFGWTLWLILLNVAPNDTVNSVMHTSKFDYGSFWLMVDPSKAMAGVATFGLAVVALGYLSLLVNMLPCIRWPTNTSLLRQVSSKGWGFFSRVQKLIVTCGQHVLIFTCIVMVG